MNLLRTPTILFIGLLVLIAERVYFFNTSASRNVAEQQVKPISPDEQYSRYAKPNKNIYPERNVDIFNTDTQKLVIHSPDVGLGSVQTRKTASNTSDEIWDRYSFQLPKLYWLNDANNRDIEYSENNAKQMQYLAYDGDPLAQFVYAYYLTKKIEEEAIANKVSLESARQSRRFKEIRDLHIKAATKGVYPSASALSRIYMMPGLKDQAEALAWGFIANSMRRGEDKTLENICTDPNNSPCTHEMLSSALDRARSYVKMHSFKVQK